MALSTAQIVLEWKDGVADRTALLALLNFTTGDTADLSQWFSSLKAAVLLVTTQPKKGLPTVTGTIVTLDIAGLAGDAGYLLVWGAASPPATT
jgi:hypothetical protein